jgi:eukaryotic-like serine/threonine-protein kinase
MPPDSPEGLCPECLLRAALPGDASSSQTVVSESKPADPAPHTLIKYFGDYELLEEIARGGMGVVWKARQKSLHRTVAVKMILGGQLATDADVKRFHTEAEAAANLDHPHIVPIYEVGEHEGQHYFSMKLVEGRSLAAELPRYTSDHLAAAVLLAKVSRAVHHAHQRGILHRDLKPGNILLDAQGGPHVTDFGLAKQVKGDSELTISGAILGTPAYMAPEQALGKMKELSTAADIYSLGAILYQLLTGRPPFIGDNLVNVLRQVTETEPTPPSKLAKAVDRDLETICLKCLEKEPKRRYASADALAEELERWLRNEPVLARPVGGVERLAKWARRRPALAAMTTALILVALTGFTLTYRQLGETQVARAEAERKAHAEVQARSIAQLEKQQAELQRDRANSEATKSEQSARFMTDMLAGIGPSVALGRDTTMLREIVDKAATRLDKELTGQPAVEADLRATLGNAYIDLGEFTKAESMHRRTLALRRSFPGNEPLAVANSLVSLAKSLSGQSRYAEAEAVYREALSLQQNLLGQDHPDIASSLIALGHVLDRQGKYREAMTNAGKGLDIQKKQPGTGHADEATALSNLAFAELAEGKTTEAEALLRQVITLRKRSQGTEHPDVAKALVHLGSALLDQGKFEEAESLCREALVIQRKLLDAEHPEAVISMDQLACALAGQRKYEEAEKLFLEARAGSQSKTPTPLQFQKLILSQLVRFYKDWSKTDASKLTQANEWQQKLDVFNQTEGPKMPNEWRRELQRKMEAGDKAKAAKQPAVKP